MVPRSGCCFGSSFNGVMGKDWTFCGACFKLRLMKRKLNVILVMAESGKKRAAEKPSLLLENTYLITYQMVVVIQ